VKRCFCKFNGKKQQKIADKNLSKMVFPGNFKRALRIDNRGQQKNLCSENAVFPGCIKNVTPPGVRRLSLSLGFHVQQRSSACSRC